MGDDVMVLAWAENLNIDYTIMRVGDVYTMHDQTNGRWIETDRAGAARRLAEAGAEPEQTTALLEGWY